MTETAADNLLRAAKAAHDELAAIHGHTYPDCQGKCAAKEILRWLSDAIMQAEQVISRPAPGRIAAEEAAQQ